MPTGWPSQTEVDAYVAARSPFYGIDPTMAVRVRRSESKIGYVGDQGTSFGPFQLHYGGGLGDTFTSDTGMDARNPSTWKAQVDYALSYAQRHGWGAFKGAAREGIGLWDGIRQATQAATRFLTYFFPLVGWSGNVRETYHTSGAADLFAAAGTRIRNMIGGRVVSVGTSGPGGNSVLVKGEDGRDYYYAHMQDKPAVSAGDYVPGGALLGKVGESGNARGTGAHLHIGIGYGISQGTGASGGAGQWFDAQSFLGQILQAGGAGDSGAALEAIMNGLDPGAIGGAVQQGATGVLGSLYQGAVNYVQDRAAATVLLMAGIAMTLIGLFALAMKSDTVRTLVKTGASKVNPVAGVVAGAAL